jgi:hypothetical protein
MKTKIFDCIQVKRAAQEKIRAAVVGLDRKAEIEFFRAGAKAFERRIQAAKESLARTGKADGC